MEAMKKAAEMAAEKGTEKVKVKHGDTYFGTPKGQNLRSLKAAERWLGLAAPTPAAASAAAASASASSASTSASASGCRPG